MSVILTPILTKPERATLRRTDGCADIADSIVVFGGDPPGIRTRNQWIKSTGVDRNTACKTRQGHLRIPLNTAIMHHVLRLS
jgi:hypothetical protein